MTAPILVTGATGFIGRYVVQRLLAEGAAVRVFVRRPALLAPDQAARVEVRQGDICDTAALRGAVAGCTTVLHLAACARAWCRDPATFAQVNLDAVRALLRAVDDYGVHRLVHVSTVLTLPRHDARRAATSYEVTKLAGERCVEENARSVIVHPTRVYGPGPLNDANGVTRVVALYLHGRFRARLDDHDVQANYVHADDVAAGIIAAARVGTAGGHYALGGENESLRGLLERVAAISGVHHRVFRIRPGAALAAAFAAEAWGRLGGTVPITRGWVRLFLEDQRLEHALTPPGYSARGLDTGLTETIDWLRSQGRRAA
jgi:nucleoside-diphosphate-sugar epimerase